MLQSDPSTAATARGDRLDAQDRVALYAYSQAIREAGYGFSRVGEEAVLSTDEFTDAVINNSPTALSSALDDFEMVLLTDVDAADASAVTVHLITYGYAVDYSQASFSADNVDQGQGIAMAQTILDVKTPDELYGNSIEGNVLWSDRNLPEPNANDTFQGDGRPSSNLYSGTKMFGALQGLEHLLSEQAAANNGSTTLVAMTTDGRPERRVWWDTREGPGSDSIIGEAIPLPDALGVDPITTSGLLYDRSGNPVFMEDNNGDRPWPQMQRDLNAALDALADQASCKDGVAVEVVAMGDETEADFPAIYADLFEAQTFEPANGGWRYDTETSYYLPDFSD